MVTLERQMAPGTDWNRDTRGSIPNCSPREGTPNEQLQTPQMKDTPRETSHDVFRNPEEDDDPLLELLQTQSSPEASEATDPDRPQQDTATRTRKPRIKWPKASDKTSWTQLDEDLENILEASMQGPVDRKLTTLTTLIYSVGKERFGLEEERVRMEPPRPNRWQVLIQNLRRELKQLRRRYCASSPTERIGVAQLRDTVRTQLTSLRKAENSRRKTRERAKKRAAFTANPYKFARSLLDKERSGKLETPLEEIENFLHVTHSDPKREDVLGDCDRIDPAEEPEKQLNATEPTLGEVKEAVKKARAASAPGPNAIPYKVYKMCPLLLKRLWRLLKVVWRKGDTVNQFRTISLLNLEGKIFFAILARRLTSFLTGNAYINTSVQKGGVPGFSGCIEHTSAITQLISEAKKRRKDPTVVWLDLASACGSIPHQLIYTALRHYHVDGHIQKIITSYLDGIRLRFTVGDQLTRWQKLENGIVTGCTVSMVLFILGMNLLINAAQRETRGPKTESGIYVPSSRGFLDDLTLTTTTHVQARWMLTSLTDVASWGRMKFKASKSRSLVIKKGQTTQRYKLYVQNEKIPSIVTSPIKCLGKWFDASLQDRDNVKNLKQQVEEGLKKIDRCGLPGKFKAWLYQHALLPRLIWPLMLYEVPSTTVEALERITSRHLRKWLGVPPSFTRIGLYGKSNKLQLPLSSLVEEFKTAKARLVLTMRDSPDEIIREAGIQTRTSRKWSATESVSQAENALKHKDIVGVTAVGREGIGARKVVLWSRPDQKERRAMTQSEVRRAEENARQARAVEMGAQGAWTTWNTADRKLTWGDIWKYEPFRFSFLLRSVYDLLPSPANLCRWGLTAEPKCSLCDRVGTLEHVLSSCSTALTPGRYRSRHDLVLRELADWLEKERKKEHCNHPRYGHVAFVKSGETGKTQKPTKASILDGSRDWKMEVDLDRRLVFPNVVQTTLRPDIVLWSETGKKLVTIELKVTWEARWEEAYEWKKAKYTELMDLCKQHVLAQADESIRNNWQGETSGYPETEPSSRTGIKLAVAEVRGEELEAINQHTVTDHHCGPTAIRMFMELKGRNILRRRNPC
ncbi:uncharacterized protein LOC127878274 [Dreissena polymorpha]|uniref:uncharacterized protein LOC127878274 n=1 Tax=Dreissena polymorpha TaxID=45954 RepID=UPI0022643FD9|nr:uncharacterized protein LOC127878274 [Dreissena polymorpha]